jgi:hypothetical protein
VVSELFIVLTLQPGGATIHAMQTHKKSVDWEGCFPAVERAATAVQVGWEKNPKSGEKRQLAAVFTKRMQPAWRSYVRTLPKASALGSVCRSLRMVCPPGPHGFKRLDELVKLLVRIADADGAISKPQCAIFIATIDRLRDLLQLFDVRAQTRGRYGDDFHCRDGFEEWCRFCGKHTELHEALSKGKRPYPRLSGLFCEAHKRRLQNGEQNPAYRQAVRSEARFEEVLKGLHRQAQLGSYLNRKKHGPVESDFYSQLMADIDPDEGAFTVDLAVPMVWKTSLLASWEILDISQLRNTAREIVDYGITEKRMQIIALRRSGLGDSEVALRLKMSPQALASAIDSIAFRQIPKRFRSDLRKRRHHLGWPVR